MIGKLTRIDLLLPEPLSPSLQKEILPQFPLRLVSSARSGGTSGWAKCSRPSG